MASPQAENGHLRIANEIVKQLAKLNLPAYEWRLLWAVLLKTWAWRKKCDLVPISQIVEMTGLRQPHASRAKASLLKKRILFEQAGKLGFQKDYELWAVEGFAYTNSGMSRHTDSGMKTAKSYTNSGTGHTDSGMKSIPIQGDSKEKKATTQKQQRAEVVKSFREHWNAKGNLPRIRAMTKDRKKKLAARMKEPDFADNWRGIIDRISASAFCTGDNERGWKADITWLLTNSENYVKVLEGKYDNKPKPEPQRGDPDWLPSGKELDEIYEQCPNPN
ncbi:MAG: replication protein [Planctomycetota bacterium]|jgi:phage replication O-like protein O